MNELPESIPVPEHMNTNTPWNWIEILLAT